MIGRSAGRLVHRRLAGELGLAAAVAVIGVLMAGGEVMIYLSHAAPVVRRSMAEVELWQYVLQGSSMVITGFLVLAHRVARVLGWLLLGAAVVFMVAACLSTWLRFTTEITPLVRVAVYGEYALWEVPRVVFVLIPLFFPTGRLPGRWARPLAVGLPIGILAVEASALLGFRWWHPGGVPMRNALYSARWAAIQPAVQPLLEILVWVGIIVVTVTPVLRWRGSDRLARRQIAIAVSIFVLFLVEEGLRHLFFWSWWVAAAKLVVAVVWPATIGYVVIRDRLYELDLAARRIIAGVVPVVLLAAVYMGAAVTMSLAVPRDGATLAAVLAVLAALVGLVLRPISGWVVARVDRLLYGDRAEPYQLARRLAGQLRDGVGPAQTPVAVCQIVVSALRLPGAALDVTVVQPPRRVAEVGELSAELEPFDLRYHGKLVGRLLVPPRPGQSQLDDLDRIVLQPLADLAAPAVSALWLQEELATSRVQLVSAREDERRRLRQDVHDGLGPSLAAIRLRVDTAVALLPAGSTSGSLLADVSRDLHEIVTELRRITENLRPPALERLGLAGALTELADRLSSPSLPVDADLPADTPPLPSIVELAAYRIAAEALANAIRHAAATRATVRLAVTGDRVTLTVTDDGTGFRPEHTSGSGLGLRSMAERATDIGGRCRVDSDSDGTTVTAELPTTLVVPGFEQTPNRS